jgi:Ca2+-binding RTX toxin-like protein
MTKTIGDEFVVDSTVQDWQWTLSAAGRPDGIFRVRWDGVSSFGSEGDVSATREQVLKAPLSTSDSQPDFDALATDGPDFLEGTPRNDRIFGLGGNDTIKGLGGNDLLRGDAGSDSVDGGLGNDQIWAGPTDDGDDTLDGGNGNDVVAGGPGRDTITVSSGQDTLYGGDDNDRISPFGNDQTGPGDIAWAGNGDDSVFLGAGNDTAGGGNGVDFLSGDDGNDVLYGGPDAAEDRFLGGGGNDTLFGGGGDDTIFAGDGDDLVFNGPGSDDVIADGGDDTLYGGPGDDTLTGDDPGGTVPGADVFAFASGNGNDTVRDFDPAVDRIQVETGFDSVSITEDFLGDAVMTFSDVSVLFKNVSVDTLDDASLFI